MRRVSHAVHRRRPGVVERIIVKVTPSAELAISAYEMRRLVSLSTCSGQSMEVRGVRTRWKTRRGGGSRDEAQSMV